MDTAGQERFKSINTSYYRRADCCLLVYDITDRLSFEEIQNYFSETIKEKCKANIPIILLGNKTDLENERKVQSVEGANFSLKNNYIFMETSCFKNSNVSDAFETLKEITNRETLENKNKKNNEQLLKNETITISMDNHNNENEEKSSCSC